MTTQPVELSKIIRVHYGAALKEADRVQSGSHDVFGSAGVVGRHSEALFEYPSIVIGRKGSVGSVTYAPNGGWAIDTAYFVERIDRRQCDLRYLFYALSNARLAQHTITTSIPGLSRDDIYRTRVLLPPVPEQRRIANILDKADAIRRKRKEAIGLTDDLLRSAFLELFGDPVTNPKGWQVRPLGDVSEVSGGLQVTSTRASNPIVMPYLRVANVYRDRLHLSEVKEIRVTEAERSRATLRPGDVLVVEGHGNPEELGRAAVWRDEIAGCTHQNHLIRVRPDAAVLEPVYVSVYLNSASGRQQMLRLGKTTSGLNTISTNNVRSVRVIVPPLQLQAHYARTVERVRRLASRMQRRSNEDGTLFNALVARAFAGSLEAAC